MIKQTAGRDSLVDFAPKFAELNDDVLFGEVWSREKELDLKTRSIINGVTKEEFSEIITHVAFYAGWPNAWSVFNMAKEVYDNE